MAAGVEIRPVRPTDYDAWLPLWDGYNEFHGRAGATALDPAITEATWQRFFDPGEPVFALGSGCGRLIGRAGSLSLSPQHDVRGAGVLPAGSLHDTRATRSWDRASADRGRLCRGRPGRPEAGVLANPGVQYAGPQTLRAHSQAPRVHRLQPGRLRPSRSVRKAVRASRSQVRLS